MNIENVNTLSEKQEKLLALYYDRECNFIEKFQVKRIIKSNPLAVEFLNDLEKCSEIVNEEMGNVGVNNLSDFCSTLNQRITNEEHAEIFHGSRAEVVKFDSYKKINLNVLPWALSGALALALFLDIRSDTPLDVIDNGLPKVVANKEIKMPSRVQVARKNSSSSSSNLRVSNVSSFGGMVTHTTEDEIFDATPYLKQREYLYNPDVEVDWIRSNGSVHLIQQRDTKAPLIWISRRK